MIYVHIHTGDAYKEEEHPRGEGGKWTSGGGGNAPKHPDLVGHKVSELDPKSVVHFVGFKEGDQHYQNAVDVFGEPAFFHRVWDVRAQGDIVPGDTVVFAKGDSDQKPSAYVYDDSNQPDDPAAKERLEENRKPKTGDAAFKEDEHPRGGSGGGKGGQFVAKGEGGGGSMASLLHESPEGPREKKKDKGHKKDKIEASSEPRELASKSHAAATAERKRVRAELRKHETFGTWAGTAEELQQWGHDAIHSTCKTLDFEPERVDVAENEKTFELDGKTHTSAGTSNPKTGRITLYQPSIGPGTDEVLAHEIMHQKFDSLLARMQGEAKQAKEAGDDEKKPDPKKYPVYAVFKPLLLNRADELGSNAHISEYSDLYWKGWKKKKVSVSLAFSESLAEMSRLHWRDGQVPGNKAWQELYWAVNDLYSELKHKEAA